MGSILYIALAWLLLALCSLLPAQQAFADSAEVPAGLPEKQCSSDLIRNITTLIDTGDAGQSVTTGVLYKDNFSTAHARVVCNCPNESYSISGVTYSAYYALPDNGQAGNIWAILNESLQLRLPDAGQPMICKKASYHGINSRGITMSLSKAIHQPFRYVQICLGLCCLMLLSWSAPALAALPSYQCATNPTYQQTYVVTRDLGDAGTTGSSRSYDLDTGFQFSTMTCNCSKGGGTLYSLFTTTTSLPVDGDGWMKLNPFVDAKLGIKIGSTYQQVPFANYMSYAHTTACSKSENATNNGTEVGSASRLTLRLTKGLLGELTYSGELSKLYLQLKNNNEALDYGSPITVINLNLTLRSNASCSFQEGDTFNIDMGKIVRSRLNESGAPDGYTPRTINLSLDCTDVDGYSNIDYTFQSASGSSGDYLLTNLTGLGIGLLDGNDNPIGFGIDNTVSVPLQDSSTSFFIKPVPVKLAGQTVENGQFMAHAIVTVSLP